MPLSLEHTEVSGKPFLKWPGGKRWASNRIVSILDNYGSTDGTYFEPFLGSGAIFFALKPRKAVLTDINTDLIITYKAVRDYAEEIKKELSRTPVNKKNYYKMRESEPRSALSRAVRFLYLNRTAFAGMYRLNSDGKFNVPFNGGDRDTSILYKTPILSSASMNLQNADIRVADFEVSMKKAGKGDIIYCDPTYTVAHGNNGFVRYNENNFLWIDQERLLNASVNAVSRGATVIVSNAFHASIHRLYSGWKRLTLMRTSTICPNVNYRKDVKESLFVLSGPDRD